HRFGARGLGFDGAGENRFGVAFGPELAGVEERGRRFDDLRVEHQERVQHAVDLQKVSRTGQAGAGHGDGSVVVTGNERVVTAVVTSPAGDDAELEIGGRELGNQSAWVGAELAAAGATDPLIERPVSDLV